ncbi:MAG: hypothetical protein LBD28_00320 [Tannerellaceae bacterium]|jgi:hypothetical protein|nr:hypothetical protein [Tannerellaceae bacterium]
MKTLGNLSLFFLALQLWASCADTHFIETDLNVPIYMDFETMRSAFATSTARELKNPGKICFKDNLLFIVEVDEGIHVIDVSDPTAPRNLSFLSVGGCKDIAIRNQSLYAGNYVDVAILDISDLSNVTESGRIKDVLSYNLPPLKDPSLGCEYDLRKGLIVGWEVKRVKRKTQSSSYPEGDWNNLSPSPPAASPGGNLGGGGGSIGQTGSMARFGLYDHYLYLMIDNSLLICDVEASTVGITDKVYINYFETMFIHDDHIFFGAPNGMFVYSLEFPTKPALISSYSHVRSCDPVVVQDHYAYITMRGGSACGGSANQLDIVKLSDDYRETELVSSYLMEEPYGLGVDGNTLFVCDGPGGLKVYDLADKNKLKENQLAKFPSIQAYDVIPTGNYLFMIGQDGFYLYDYSDPKDIKRLSHIPVNKGT